MINYVASLARKNVQKTTFEAADMMLGPWNQQQNGAKSTKRTKKVNLRMKVPCENNHKCCSESVAKA